MVRIETPQHRIAICKWAKQQPNFRILITKLIWWEKRKQNKTKLLNTKNSSYQCRLNLLSSNKLNFSRSLNKISWEIKNVFKEALLMHRNLRNGIKTNTRQTYRKWMKWNRRKKEKNKEMIEDKNILIIRGDK